MCTNICRVGVRAYLQPQGRSRVVAFDSDEELHEELHLLHQRALAERKAVIEERLQHTT